MLQQLTSREKRALSFLTLIIVLGLIGMAML
jgi:hypothetical protein